MLAILCDNWQNVNVLISLLWLWCHVWWKWASVQSCFSILIFYQIAWSQRSADVFFSLSVLHSHHGTRLSWRLFGGRAHLPHVSPSLPRPGHSPLCSQFLPGLSGGTREGQDLWIWSSTLLPSMWTGTSQPGVPAEKHQTETDSGELQNQQHQRASVQSNQWPDVSRRRWSVHLNRFWEKLSAGDWSRWTEV